MTFEGGALGSELAPAPPGNDKALEGKGAKAGRPMVEAMIAALCLAGLLINMTRRRPSKRARRSRGKVLSDVLFNLRRDYPNKPETWRWQEAQRIMRCSRW